jgi:type VI protein secretion system component VasK
MPDLPSYARRRLTRASLETAGFTYRKLLVGACMAVIVRLALWHFRQVKLSSADVWADLVIIVGSYGAVVLASFVWNWFRTPALLDAEAQREIKRLSEKLELPDKAQAEYLRGLLAKLSDNGKAVLRFALFHEEITNKQLSTVLPSWEDVQNAYQECLDSGLLKWRNDCPDQTNPMIWAYDCYWVPSEFRIPLQRLLSESKS